MVYLRSPEGGELSPNEVVADMLALHGSVGLGANIEELDDEEEGEVEPGEDRGGFGANEDDDDQTASEDDDDDDEDATGQEPASSERHFDRRLTIMSEPNGTMGEASTWKKKASGGAETVESAQDATKTGVDGVGSSASSGPKAQAAAGGGGCCVIM